MQGILPIFSTHHSVGHSILTAEKESEIDEKKPVSVFAIAKTHGEKILPVVDTDIAGYWKMYKSAKELDVQLVYGIKLTVCTDMSDKTDEGEQTDSKVIVMFKNSESYYKFVPIYSVASTSGQSESGQRRIDWKTLKELWSDELDLLIPFYSSFLAKNLLKLNHRAMPDFSTIAPTFLYESHDLPFDAIIQNALKRYVVAHKYEMIQSHQIYYYKDKDVMTYQTLQCITQKKPGRPMTWQKPNLDHFGSDQFSYESYQRRNGRAA